MNRLGRRLAFALAHLRDLRRRRARIFAPPPLAYSYLWNLFWWAQESLTAEERRPAFDPDHPYREPVRLGYPYLIAAGSELVAAGVRFHDATYLFSTVDATVYFDTCCHFNQDGNELLARRIADAIRRDLER